MGLVKNREVGRSFIQPRQETRTIGVQLKLNPIKKVVEGKRIVVVDDSIIRGTTIKNLVNMFLKAGAREVHLRISSSPIISPCFYGFDMQSREELISSKMEKEEICRNIGATSLEYLSLQGMLDAVGLPPEGLCLACFSGKYPV